MHHPQLLLLVMQQRHQARLDEADHIRTVHRLADNRRRRALDTDKILNGIGTRLVRLGRRMQRTTWQTTSAHRVEGETT